MKDLLIKLIILKDRLMVEFNIWRKEVWSKDLDSNYCCDGRECGCYGASIREVYWNHRK